MPEPIDRLLDELNAAPKWPPPRELRVYDRIATHRAYLESDRDALKIIAGWPSDRDYKVDPLGELIADAWADHVFGEELDIAAADDADRNALALVLEGTTDLLGDLHEAERLAVGEGEVWWRIYRDEDVADVPLVEWHSRDAIIPLYVGAGRGLLKAAAIVTELDPKPGDKRARYRHLEIHADTVVEHVLYRGTPTRLGHPVPLETHPDLEELDNALAGEGLEPRGWDHGLPMLVGRITNGRRVDRRLRTGVSDYQRIADYLLDLNEAVTIGAENARLTAKKRVVIDEDALPQRRPELVDRGDGTLARVDAVNAATADLGADVLVRSRMDRELGQDADAMFKVIEYSFDAEALIAYKRDVVESALTRVGMTPQYVGVVTGQGDGLALSGTALRLRLIPTTKTGQGKAAPWDRAVPHILGLLQRLDALPEADGGFGRPWQAAELNPIVERTTALPHDDVEDAQVEATLVGAGLRSRRTSIERQHPDWTEEQVDDELDAIASERPATSAAGALGLT